MLNSTSFNSTPELGPNHLPETTLRAEIYRDIPDLPDESESKVLSMTGLSREQMQIAIAAAFPDWKLFCIWELQADEF